MKALTLYQPFATLIAIRWKPWETRSWPTNYRGPLAIHAAKRIPPELKNYWSFAAPEPFRSALKDVLWTEKSIGWGTEYKGHSERLHLGCVIATCNLANVYRVTNDKWMRDIVTGEIVRLPSEPYFSFGDFSLGRYVWLLTDVKPLPEPIPAKGALGLWEWVQP